MIDPYKASHGVEDAEYAVIQLAQTTMRSELGKIKLDSVFQERTNLNFSIVEVIDHAAEAWGIRCMRYEIKNIQLPTKVREAMQMQVEAERQKRANILESEGVRESVINRAAGLRQSKILASEAVRIEQINQAKGEASAFLAKPLARSEALSVLGQVLRSQAMAIYGHMTSNINETTPPDDDGENGHPLSDFDETLEKLNQSIDEALTKRFDDRPLEKSTGTKPHFTLASSPTRGHDQT